jgi:hypothetical protein
MEYLQNFTLSFQERSRIFFAYLDNRAGRPQTRCFLAFALLGGPLRACRFELFLRLKFRAFAFSLSRSRAPNFSLLYFPSICFLRSYFHARALYIYTARTGLADKKDRTGRAEWDRQSWTIRRGQAEQDRQNRTGRTGQA